VLTYSVAGGEADDSRAGFTHSVEGEYGTLYYNSATGAYEYVANNADSLAQGEKASENFQVTVTDEHGASDSKGLDVNLTGTNNAPVLDAIAGAEVAEGASVSGQFHGTDVDHGAVLTYSVDGGSADGSRAGFTHSVQGEYGTLYYNSATGAYEYVADSASKLTDTPKENFTVKVTDEHGASDTQSLDVDLTGYDNPNLVLTQGTSTSITEGGGISFSMQLTSSSGNPMTADQPMTVTFLVTSTAIFDWTAAAQAGIEHEPNPGGGWLVTVTLPAGESMADINIPTVDAPGFQGDRSVTISDMEVDGGGFGGNINVYGESEFNYTVQDATSFHVESGAAFNGSASQHGLEIYGGEGGNEIIGSDHGDVIHAGDGGSHIQGGAGDDTIFAGQGDDTLSGGDGNNIFAWESDKFGGSDTIVDFSFNHEWDAGGGLQALDGMFNDKIQINFQDLLGSPDDGNSLGALLQGLSGSGASTFSYSTDQGGFTAQFSDCGKEMVITLTGSDESTLQTITVQSNTAFHDNIQNISSDEAAAILQQVLLCSSD